jgi:hypothetical protein
LSTLLQQLYPIISLIIFDSYLQCAHFVGKDVNTYYEISIVIVINNNKFKFNNILLKKLKNFDLVNEIFKILIKKKNKISLKINRFI